MRQELGWDERSKLGTKVSVDGGTRKPEQHERGKQVVILPVNATDNSQIKRKREGKRCNIGTILALGWCS